jgi:polyisoprenoid-binding protein YceI
LTFKWPKTVVGTTNQVAGQIALFTPTNVSGLPESMTNGQPYAFQVAGDLTISGVTRQAVCNGTVTQAADGTLVGSASTTIDCADWGLSIPSVPFVASVGNQVSLNFDFTAVATA